MKDRTLRVSTESDVEAEAGPKVGPPMEINSMNREAVARELSAIARELISYSVKYKGYSIEMSGGNFYVTDPSGHRAFEEVPASIETAKKWIDADIRGGVKRYYGNDKENEMNRELVASELLAVARELVAMDFPTQDAMDKYLKNHPDADRSNHKVVRNKNHPSNADMKALWEMGQTKPGFDKALKEHAGSSSPEDIKKAAKDFHDTAKTRKKELEGHIIGFLKKNGKKGLLDVSMLNDISNDEDSSGDVRRRADNLYMTHASLGNIMDMAKEKM